MFLLPSKKLFKVDSSKIIYTPSLQEPLHSISIKAIELGVKTYVNTGKCDYIALAQYHNSQYNILFSPEFFRLIPDLKKETLTHELCHIIAHSVDGTMEHNLTWRKIMADHGYPNARPRIHALYE